MNLKEQKQIESDLVNVIQQLMKIEAKLKLVGDDVLDIRNKIKVRRVG